MEINKLKGYLGTGVKFMLSQTGIFNMDCEHQVPQEALDVLELTNILINDKGYEVELTHENGWSIGFIEPSEFNIILRPLSDLTKTCLEGGKVPIEELTNIVFSDWECDENEASVLNSIEEDDFEIRCTHIESWCSFIFHKKINSFSTWIDGEGVCPCRELLLVIEKLYEWHFDIHGLIEKKEAIDINTL